MGRIDLPHFDRNVIFKKASPKKMINKWLLLYGVMFFDKLPPSFKSLFSKIMCKPRISKTALIFGHAIFKGNVEIGDYTYLNGNPILDNVKIGKYCSIARDLSIIQGKHTIEDFSTYALFIDTNRTPFEKFDVPNCGYLSNEFCKPVIIGSDVWIGSYVKILSGCNIGNGAVIGVGSVITKDVQPYSIVAGVPARVIRMRFSEDRIDYLNKLQWWEWSANKLHVNYSRLVEFDPTLLDEITKNS